MRTALMIETLAIACSALSIIVVFGVRTWLHRRRTGDAGWRGFRVGAGPAERLGTILFALGLVTAVAAPVLVLTTGPDPLLEPGPIAVAVGLALWATGTISAFGAQATMGRSWRIGVDPDEGSDLVAEGMFRWVRNPIFVAMILTQTGIVVLVPTVVAIAGLALVVAAIQIQVRLVEEPYLRAMHGAAYERYQREVGRFIPRAATRAS